MNVPLPTSMVTKIVTLAGVAAFCYFVLWISSITFISRFLALDGSAFFIQFERHFWEFSGAFIAVVVLSRGHLWSYGITSKNLKSSMIWLSWLYGGILILTAVAVVFNVQIIPDDASMLTAGTTESIIALLVYWMSSPVANQILFFSFAQTVLMKQWGDSITFGGVPLAVIIPSIMFAAGATSSHFGADPIFVLHTFLLGLFCGTVYWKTTSLITPMLGHAFFFGFPVFIYLLRSGISR